MLFWGFIFGVLVLNALFNRSFFGIDARALLTIFILGFILFFLYHQFFFKEMYEVLIEEEQITFSQPLREQSLEFPLYGKNQNYHFVIYPAVHYRFPIENECQGFVPTDRKTWCGNAGVIPQCNTPNDQSNCTIITEF